jgi:hypothetical protein
VSQDLDKTTDADARAAELREELAITEQRRAEEAEAEAEAAVADAQRDESKKERKRREAEERRAAATAEAERARAEAAERARAETAPPRAAEPFATSAGTVVEGPARPELLVAAAFGGAFLFARILKKIAE